MTSLLVSCEIPDECERTLSAMGYNVMRLPAARALAGSAVATHPDSLIFHHENTLITSCDYCDDGAYIFSDLRHLYPALSVRFCDDLRAPSFPQDCIYNAAVSGDKVFARTKSLSQGVLSYAKKAGLKLINVKQGYPACATLFVGKRAITADAGLARIYAAEGLRVTLISPGGIELPPHAYGFIGGACGVVGNTVYFFGDIDTHPDSRAILEAIESEGYLSVSLSSGALRDIGGMIVLSEQGS